MTDNRKQILPALVPYFKADDRYFLLYGDSGFGGVEAFTEAGMGDRIFNYGIAEQSMVGVAAGMAMAGMIPVVYTISNFLVYRAFEQIRNDIVLQNLNVKLIGTGAGNYYRHLGRSHTTSGDDTRLMYVAGIKVFEHVSLMLDYKSNFNNMVKDFITNKKAGYLSI